MKVAIRTAGKRGQNIEKIIREFYPEIQVVAYIDSSPEKIGEKQGELPIISVFDLAVYYQRGEMDRIIIPCEFHSMNYAGRNQIERFCHELETCGVAPGDILITNFIADKWKAENNAAFEVNFVDYQHFYHLRYLEIPLAFHCNLNCKGCSHFSPLVDKEFPEFEQVRNDFHQLKKYVPHIHRIRLLGGEPLLNKELDRYIEMIRNVYPYTDLRIVTNGLLVKQLKDEDIDCIRNNDVIVDISVYPCMRRQYDEILKWLKQKHVKSTLSNSYEFVPTFTDKKTKYPFREAEKTCIHTYMTEGTISTCMLMHDTKYYNRYFGENLPYEEGMINLYDPELTSEKLISKLKQSYPLCDYCEAYKHMSPELANVYHNDMNISWGLYTKQDPPKKEDWIYREE